MLTYRRLQITKLKIYKLLFVSIIANMMKSLLKVTSGNIRQILGHIYIKSHLVHVEVQLETCSDLYEEFRQIQKDMNFSYWKKTEVIRFVNGYSKMKIDYLNIRQELRNRLL